MTLFTLRNPRLITVATLRDMSTGSSIIYEGQSIAENVLNEHEEILSALRKAESQKHQFLLKNT